MKENFKKIFSTAFVAFLILAQFPAYHPAKAQWTGTITIKPDGSVEPADAPIARSGNIYTLTSDIRARAERAIVILRPNTVLDGGGHTISDAHAAVLVKDAWHVTIKNLKTKLVSYGVYLINSSYAIITNNEINSLIDAVYILDSIRVTIEHNSFTRGGIYMHYYSTEAPEINNIIRNNTVNGLPLIYLEREGGKTISGELGQLVIINCTNIKATDLTITNTSLGVLLLYAKSVDISSSRFTYNDYGISIVDSKNISITNSDFDQNNRAINAYLSSINVKYNNFIDNPIVLRRVNESRIEKNVFIRGGIELDAFSNHNVVRDNTVNGLPLVYLEGENSKTVSGKLGQLIIVNCTDIKVADVELGNIKTLPIQIVNSQNITVTGAKVSKAKDGIIVLMSKQVTIKRSVIESSERNGILLSSSSQILVTQNSITGSKRGWGIMILRSHNNTVTWNLIAANRGGLFVYLSKNNLIALNQIIGNRAQAKTTRSRANRWDNGTHGNFWSDYSGTDSDGDGIGDQPYTIDQDNVDRYPLMTPPLAAKVKIEVASPYGEASGAGLYAKGQTVNVSVTPQTVDHGNGTRRVFEGWYIEGKKICDETTCSFKAEKPATIEAKWRTEYYVNVSSKLGEASGSGWYAKGSAAVATIKPTTIEGIIQNQVFAGWSTDGKIVSTASTYAFVVNGPVNLEAVWKTELNLLIVAAIAAILVIVVIAIIILAKASAKKKLPPPPPPPPNQ